LSSLLKRVLPNSQCFQGEEQHCSAKWPLSSELRNPVALVRQSLMLEARGSSTLLSTVQWVTCLREYGLTLSVFHGWGISSLCKIASFKALHLLQEK
jgi:hypothetical protein